MNRQLGMVLAHGGPFFRRIEEFGLKRAEFIIIAPENKASLEKLIESKDIAYSVHCPLIIPEKYPENPLLASVLDFDEERRKLGVELMLDTMREAARIRAEYMVVHLSRPEHFGGPNPSAATSDQALDVASRSCDTLAEASRELGVPVLLENIMDNSIFNLPATYVELLERFPDMGFCLDVGHLDVDSRTFGFGFDEFLDALQPYLKAVHLQNSKTQKNGFANRHWKVPVNPGQEETDGWLDIERILRRIIGKKKDCIINFEARLSEDHNFEYMAEGIRWIQELLPAIVNGSDN